MKTGVASWLCTASLHDGVDQLLGHVLFAPAAAPSARRCTSPGFRACGGVLALPRPATRPESTLAADLFAVVAVEVNGLHRDRSITPSKLSSLPIGHCIRIGVAVQLFLAPAATTRCGFGAGAVHLVDERQPRHVIALHLAIDGHRLRLHAADGAKHEDRPIEHAEAAFDFDGEIDVARRVDQVDRDAVCPTRRWWRRW